MSNIYLRDLVPGTQLYKEIEEDIKRNRPGLLSQAEVQETDIVIGEFYKPDDYKLN